MDFEYTASGMPHRMAALNKNSLPSSTRYVQCWKAANSMLFYKMITAMLLENNLLTLSRNLSPFQQFFGMLSLMQKFGEMCVTTHWDNSHHVMLANHGIPGIWVGGADGYPTGTYQVFNPKTKKITLTREVTFLQKSYRDYNKAENSVLVTTSYEGSDEEEELKLVPLVHQNSNYYNVVSDSKI